MRRASRACFHYAVRMAEKNEGLIRSECMAQCILNNKSHDFWKEAKSMKGKNSKLSHSIDNVSGNSNIANVSAGIF